VGLRVVSRFTFPYFLSSCNSSRVGTVAARREAEKFPALHTFVIDVISANNEKLDHADMEMLRKTKMSSTFIREWIVERSKEEEEEDEEEAD
jgi:hypothetical protein